MTDPKPDGQPAPDFSFLDQAEPTGITSGTEPTLDVPVPRRSESVPPTIVQTSAAVRPPGTSKALSIYAVAVTALFVGLIVTGRVSLFGTHPLESLPDLKPLDQNEFQRIPDGTPLPDQHVLELGESRRFGDVVVTPLKLTYEPLEFAHFLSGKTEERMKTEPVVKLWLSFKNVAETYAFAPLDVIHVSHRSPPAGNDEQTLANSFLLAQSAQPDTQSLRFLNFLHAPDSNFVIENQNTGTLIKPGESLTVFIPCSEELTKTQLAAIDRCVWRVQFRKGVHLGSGHGVTTLIDVPFTPAEIQSSEATQVVFRSAK